VSLHPSDADRAAFVKGLKVGDTVCIYANPHAGAGHERWYKTTVERITPKGAFRVKSVGGDDLLNFDSLGSRRCGGSWGWHELLVPWTRLVSSVLFYLDRSIVDREAVEALNDDELKAIVMSLRPLRKKDT
jgi:hypothetical protein